MTDTLGCGHPDKNRACGDCLDEAVEAFELARTYTGLEAEGCPLCTYEDGVFTEPCSFHRKLQVMELENQELKNEVARLTRNDKCYDCGHSRESHDYNGCLIWVNADSYRKCLCKVWVASEKR